MSWLTDGLSKAEVRAILAVILSLAFIAFVFIILVYFPQQASTVTGAFISVESAIIGYYFGSKTAETQTSRAENQTSQAS